jgi:hypothetical protein
MKRRTASTMVTVGQLVLPRDGRPEIEPVEQEVRLVRKGGILVAIPVEASEPLRNETVRETLASLRARRG